MEEVPPFRGIMRRLEPSTAQRPRWPAFRRYLDIGLLLALGIGVPVEVQLEPCRMTERTDGRQ
eukprot:7587427-Alexandrium_andersonii.AAC.1